jgi:hypothetical protein
LEASLVVLWKDKTMAIGDTVQAGLMRIDSSPILLAGQAQARANQAFGDAIGGVVEKFYQKKKEKQEREQRERAYRKMGLSAEEAKAASGDKDLANQFMNKLNADRNYQLRLDDFAMRQEAFKSQQDMLDEQKALNESLAKFSMQPVKTATPEFSALQQQYRPEQIPGTPEFIAMEESEPMGARPSIIAKTITEQPDFKRFEKQDSPAVAQLPDSFKPQGRRIQEAVESGELSNQAGMMAINKIYGQAIARQKDAPTINEQIALDKRREELEERKELKASEKRQRESLLNETNDILEIIKKGKDVTGQVEGLDFVRALKKSVGYGKEDEKLRRKLERYANKFTLENVSKLKGPLSEKELAFIQQSSPKITDEPEVWVDFLTSLEEQLNTENQGETPQVDPSAPASQSLLDEIERKRQLRSKRAGL